MEDLESLASEDVCLNLSIAISQRKNELEAGFGLKGTAGFEKMGCYKCNGINSECPSYMPKKELYSENE